MKKRYIGGGLVGRHSYSFTAVISLINNNMKQENFTLQQVFCFQSDDTKKVIKQKIELIKAQRIAMLVAKNWWLHGK